MNNISSSIELKVGVDIVKLQKDETYLGLMLIRYELHVFEGMISHDLTKPTTFFDIVNNNEIDISSLSGYTDYIRRKEIIIRNFKDEFYPDLDIEEVSKQLKVDEKFIIILPKINACAAMIIKSNDNKDLNILVHIPTPKVLESNFNNLLGYFTNNIISNITLLSSWVWGGPDIFNDMAKKSGIIVTECQNQDVYSYLLSNAVLEAFGCVPRSRLNEPKSYHIMLHPLTNNVFIYYDENNITSGPGLFLFTNMCFSEQLLLFASINKQKVVDMKTYRDIQAHMSYIVFREYFPDNILNYFDMLKYIPKTVLKHSSAGGKRKFKSRIRRPRRNITRRQKNRYKRTRHSRQQNKY